MLIQVVRAFCFDSKFSMGLGGLVDVSEKAVEVSEKAVYSVVSSYMAPFLANSAKVELALSAERLDGPTPCADGCHNCIETNKNMELP